MKVHQYKIDAGDAEIIKIIPLGDVHWGVVNCDEDLFRKDIEQIRRDPNAYWIGMGDMIEAINISDKRFDPRSIAPRYRIRDLDDLPNRQARELVSEIVHIMPRCIGWHTGNHEETIRNRYHSDVTGYMCYQLGIDMSDEPIESNDPYYLDYCALTELLIHRDGGKPLKYTIFSEHGKNGGRTPGTALNAVMKSSQGFDADIFLRAHLHQRAAAVQPRLFCAHVDGKMKLRDRFQAFCVTGTYFRSYKEGASSYAEKASYPPTPLGCLRISLHMSSGEISVV